LILLGTATGVLTTEGGFTLSGFRISVSLPMFLVIGNIMLTALVVSWFGLTTRAFIFRTEIESHYKSLGFQSARMSDWLASPFRAPSVYDLLVGLFLRRGWDELRELKGLLRHEGGWAKRILWAVYVGLVLIVLVAFPSVLPVVAELIAVIRLASIVGWEHYLAWVPLLPTALVTGFAPAFNELIMDRALKHIEEISEGARPGS
jgi:hypothetical protein